jgi:phosphoesterase RecJ-like protein
MTINWTEAASLLASAQDVIVVTHVIPDGDAIGSLLGMTWVLRQLGKQVTPTVDGGVPGFLKFLPGVEDVRASLDGVRPDLVVAVDCGDAGRMGQVGAAATSSGAPVINLDHHISNTRFGTANLVVPEAVSASEIIFDWLPQLDVSLDEQIATCLLTGLVTDTLCFRTNNVTAPVLGKAQHLMDAGAPLFEITQRGLMAMPYVDIQLWAAVLPTVRLEQGVIWVVIDQATRKRVPATDRADSGLVSFLLSANEACIAAIFREKADGRVEIGLRAVPGYNVSKVAVGLGGGGHILASGATLDGPLDAVLERVLPRLVEAVSEGQAVGAG